MTKTDTRDVRATISQIERLAECGCEIVRLAVPDNEAASALGEIRRCSPLPLIADIHFDHRLALVAIENNIDQIRVNPGNIRDPKKIAAIVSMAKERAVPLRIGVNAGSLPGIATQKKLADRMVEVILENIRIIEGLDFDLIEVSLKASSVLVTIEANEIIARMMPYPIHLGVTEAGLPKAGAIRSAVGLGVLLNLGIGDSLRVSLTTSNPCEEVFTAYEILKSLELRQRGPKLISCPTCGRCESANFCDLARAVEDHLLRMEQPITVAVMGCVVNGPGEARDADVGLACGKGRGIIFRKGEKVRIVEESDFLSAILSELDDVKSVASSYARE